MNTQIEKASDQEIDLNTAEIVTFEDVTQFDASSTGPMQED